jgi:4-hydroxythreonine-4-phosphate dehydrogenase
MKTRILITIGDMNGIGPEIVLKALGTKGIEEKYDITLITPVSVLEYYYRLYGLEPVRGKFKIISICEGKAFVKPGEATKESGFIAGFAIKTAVDLCRQKRYDAIVTAPISKKALNSAGFKYDGHTEMLTALDNSPASVMFMTSSKLNMAFATNHPPLKKVSELITRKLLETKIKTSYNSLLNDFGISKPRIAVLSLNPHAGEGGQIGNEEKKIIEPAINSLRKKLTSAVIEGPFPSDGFFAVKKYKNYDLTFALYHDQGFIPFKMIAGFKGINFTAGLSFVRTSPDHGTAYDIAGKNVADPTGILEAIKTADKISKNRNKL